MAGGIRTPVHYQETGLDVAKTSAQPAEMFTLYLKGRKKVNLHIELPRDDVRFQRVMTLCCSSLIWWWLFDINKTLYEEAHRFSMGCTPHCHWEKAL